MYCRVPTLWVVPLRIACRTLAMPKSITLTRPEPPTSMRFSGLRSRWMMGGSWPCAAPSAAAVCAAIETASGQASRPAAVSRSPHGLPLEELERHDQLSIHLRAGQAAHDVRMIEMRQDGHFVEEHLASGLGAAQLRAQHLERHPAPGQPLLGLVHLAHAALADQAADEVLADPVHGADRTHEPLPAVSTNRQE